MMSLHGRLSHALARIRDFFFEARSPVPLAALRVLISLLLLIQAYMLSGDLPAFFGSHGVLPSALNDYFISDPYMYRIRNLVEALESWGLNENSALLVCGGIYVGSLLALLCGVGTRFAALIACVFHALFVTSGYYAAYGVDRFTQVALFYFIFMPTDDAFTLRRLFARTRDVPKMTLEAGFSLRILQIHLCVAYVASGIEKIVGIQWRDGEAVFRAVMLPNFHQFNMLWMAQVPWLGLLLCWGTLVLEIGYGVFIWPRATRKWWILGIEGLHFGIAVFMGLYFFAGVMAIMTFCLFAIPMLEERRALA